MSVLPAECIRDTDIARIILHALHITATNQFELSVDRIGNERN